MNALHAQGNQVAARPAGTSKPAPAPTTTQRQETIVTTAPSTHQTPGPGNSSPWTAGRIRALGTVTDVPTAAAIFGLSRSVAYDLVKTGAFPVPVLRFGARYRIPVAAILTALHMPHDPPPTGGDLTGPAVHASIVHTKSTGPGAAPRPPEHRGTVHG
jgi:hypothetical protein